MPVPLYLDECVNRHLADRLNGRDIDTTTAFHEGALGLDDPAQLQLSTRLGRVIVSHNQRHFLTPHVRYLTEGRTHAGIMVLANGPLPLLELRISMLVAWLELHDDASPLLARWHDLQRLLTGGFRLTTFDERYTCQALTIAPIDD
jgi:hypothetical protein